MIVSGAAWPWALHAQALDMLVMYMDGHACWQALDIHLVFVHCTGIDTCMTRYCACMQPLN